MTASGRLAALHATGYTDPKKFVPFPNSLFSTKIQNPLK